MWEDMPGTADGMLIVVAMVVIAGMLTMG